MNTIGRWTPISAKRSWTLLFRFTAGKQQVSGDSDIVWETFYLETIGPIFYFVAYHRRKITEDQVYFFLKSLLQ